MIDLNELEIEFTEVKLPKEEYERRLIQLISTLLALDEASGEEDIEPLEVAA